MASDGRRPLLPIRPGTDVRGQPPRHLPDPVGLAARSPVPDRVLTGQQSRSPFDARAIEGPCRSWTKQPRGGGVRIHGTRPHAERSSCSIGPAFRDQESASGGAAPFRDWKATGRPSVGATAAVARGARASRRSARTSAATAPRRARGARRCRARPGRRSWRGSRARCRARSAQRGGVQVPAAQAGVVEAAWSAWVRATRCGRRVAPPMPRRPLARAAWPPPPAGRWASR